MTKTEGPQFALRLREWSRSPGTDGEAPLQVTLPDDPALQGLIRMLSAQNKLHVRELRQGVVVETTSYVGRVTLGPLEITVEPKIDRLPLLRLLCYAFALPPSLHTSETAFSVATDSFQDLLLWELTQQAERVIARGLRREYRAEDAALASPRGRINMGQVALSAGVQDAALPCRVHTRREDILLNQIVLAGLSLGTRDAANPTLRARLRRLRGRLEPYVSPLHLNSQRLAQARRELSRLTAAYQPLLTLISLLWEDQGLSLDADTPSVNTSAFLFDMNRFFQTLLSRFLSENLSGYRLEDEHRLRGAFDYDPLFNPRHRNAPVPRPDFSLWQDGRMAAILDAKYRDLWTLHVPAEWLYQLTVYAVSHAETRTATILYPHVGPAAQESRITARDPVSAQGVAHIVLRPVDMLDLDAALAAGDGADARRIRRVLAQRIAFGAAEITLHPCSALTC